MKTEVITVSMDGGTTWHDVVVIKWRYIKVTMEVNDLKVLPIGPMKSFDTYFLLIFFLKYSQHIYFILILYLLLRKGLKHYINIKQ